MSQRSDATDPGDGDAAEHTTTDAADEPSGPTRLQSVVKLFLGTLAIVAFGYLLSLVPPFEQQLPGTPITIEAAILGVLAVIVFGLFVVIADELETVAAERLDGPGDVDESAGGILKYVVVFLAFLAVYEPLARAVVPFLAESGNAWLFDVAYAVVALLLLALTAALVYVSLDPLATMLAGYIDGDD